MSCFRSFLSSYIQFSRVWRPTLGPEEYEPVSTINWAGTVEDLWARLVRKADMEVLQPLREKLVKRTGQWPRHLELRYSSRDKEKHRSPAHLVAKVGLPLPYLLCLGFSHWTYLYQWIPALCREHGIPLDQRFEKRDQS